MIELVSAQIARLKTGYGLFCIGHTKLRDVNEKGMNEAYQQLTTSLPFDFDSIFADKADIIATVSIDKSIVDIEEIKTSKTTSKLVGSIGGVTRWIHFRDDNFNVDCGARFSEITDKVELSAENYINAIEEAIKKASGKSDTEIKTKVLEEETERSEAVKKLSEKENEVDESTNKKLIDYITSNITKLSDSTRAEAITKVKELEVKTFDDLIDKPTAKVKEIAQLMKDELGGE